MTRELTAEMLSEISRRVANGDTISVACAAVGISDRTVHRKALRQPNVRRALDQALGIRYDNLPHGASRYQHRKCRCDTCREAHRERQRRERFARRGRPVPAFVKHGKSCYHNWMCRCDVCVADNARLSAERRARAKAAR